MLQDYVMSTFYQSSKACFFFFFLYTKIFAAEVTGMSQLQHDLVAKVKAETKIVFIAALVSGDISGKAVSARARSPRLIARLW